jgi:hypothetical protein
MKTAPSLFGDWEGRAMPNNGATAFEDAAKATVDLVNHSHLPDEVSNAILRTLAEMSYECDIIIWDLETGLHVQSLAEVYRLYDRGGGKHAARACADYELGRLERERKRRKRGSNGNA